MGEEIDLNRYALILDIVQRFKELKVKTTYRRITEAMYVAKALDWGIPYKFMVISGMPQSSDLREDIATLMDAKILAFKGSIVPGKYANKLNKETESYAFSKAPIMDYATESLSRKSFEQTKAFIAAIHEVLDRPTPETKYEWVERVSSSLGGGQIALIEKEIREVAQLCD